MTEISGMWVELEIILSIEVTLVQKQEQCISSAT